MTITARIDNITRIGREYRGAVLPAPKSVKIELTNACNFRCLRGDTLVDTLYGQIPIAELAEKYQTVPVYTYQDGKVFLADAVEIRKYGEQDELVRVAFTDGTHIDCTPDHQFLLFRSLGSESGTEEWAEEAQNLQPGDRLRACRHEYNRQHNRYSIAAGRRFRKHRARMVMEYLLGRELVRTEHVHHLDHDTTNDAPGNLQLMASAKAHADAHPEIAERMRLDNPAKNMTPEWQEKITRAVTGKRRSLAQRLRYRESKLGNKNPNATTGEHFGRKSRIADVNHVVQSVQRLADKDDTYCLTVPATGWFFANHVLVKNCGFCALRTREQQTNARMDFDLFRRITTEMRAAGVEEIGVFYLGESLMAAGLTVQAVRWCKQIGFPYVFLTTNGSLASEPVVDALMDAGLDSLKFSVNAGDEDQFKSIMAVKPSLYHDALANIAIARQVRDGRNYACGIYASSIMYDGEQGQRMQATLDKYVLPYVDEHYFLPLYSMGSLATQREEELGYRPTAGNQGRLANLREPLPCWSAFTEGHVTADGKLSACCFDATSAWIMGDLNEVDFMTAWNSPDFVALREAHLRKDVTGTICESCVAYS